MEKIKNTVTERNQQWEEATAQERKILVCKDVLAMLYQDSFNIRSGVYCFNPNGVMTQEGLLENKVMCMACARGSMMLSKFRFTGAVPTVSSLTDTKNYFRQYDDIDTSIALNEVFTIEELEDIELIFETRNIGHMCDEDAYERALKHLDKFSSGNPKYRLKELMERIIYHKGDVSKAISCGVVDQQLMDLMVK